MALNVLSRVGRGTGASAMSAAISADEGTPAGSAAWMGALLAVVVTLCTPVRSM
jgi:hypothetical protein